MTRLSIEEWKIIIENVKECDPQDEFGNEFEVLWLDSTDEWALCHGYEMFEDGFATEQEAWQRYEEILTLIENK